MPVDPSTRRAAVAGGSGVLGDVTAVRGPARPRVAAVTLVEVGLAVGLLALLVGQLLGYPATDDPDPDGYVSYARHILDHGTLLPGARRLPGYPTFVAAAWAALGRSAQQSVYWVQLGLATLFVVGLWLWLRPRIGRLAALLLLGILAAPAYFTRMAVVTLPDALFSMLWLPVTLASCWWVLADRPRGAWLPLVPIGFGVLLLQAIRPNAVPIAILLVVALGVAYVGERALGRPYDAPRLAGPRSFWAKLAALLAVALVVFVVADRLLDTGARAYNADVVAYRVVVYVPPASDAPEEQRIEAAKERFGAIEGQPIEDARFLTYPTFRFYEEIDRRDVAAVWLARLLAHPGTYLVSVGRDLLLGHYLLARRVVPFFTDLERVPLFIQYYPPNDGSPAARLFRSTGIVVLERPPFPTHFPLAVELLTALTRLVAVWGLLLLGAWTLARRYRPYVVAFGVLLGLGVLLTAATNTVDPRYLLPFAIPVYATQAVGLAALARALLAGARAGASLVEPRSVTSTGRACTRAT